LDDRRRVAYRHVSRVEVGRGRQALIRRMIEFASDLRRFPEPRNQQFQAFFFCEIKMMRKLYFIDGGRRAGPSTALGR